VENNKKKLNTWAPAMQIMSEISTWIVVPIVLALIAGKALDTHFGTKPVIFLSLTGFAFIVTCFGMYKVVKNYIKKLKDIEKKD
jgi:F0F1-type ATP synthase assembly protein I